MPIDNNGLQIDGTNDEVMSLGDMAAKLKAFGFHTIELADGNDIEAVVGRSHEPTEPGKPKAILAHTVKGQGRQLHGKPGGLARQGAQ